MISRRAAKAIADAYGAGFVYTSYNAYRDRLGRAHHTDVYERDALHDMLYVNGFEPWLLNDFKSLSNASIRVLPEYIMRLHTGESVARSTPNWSWQQRSNLGQRVLKDLAECLLRERHTNPDFEPERSMRNKKAKVDAMRSCLELDGYIYLDGILSVPEQTVIEEAEEQGVLEGLMVRAGLGDVNTLKHHLELSATHYTEGRWDDSVSNSRKVLEGVAQQVAGRHSAAKGTPLAPQKLERAVAVRDYLQDNGLLDKKEKETLAEVYGLLSNTGAHPYMAQRDQARLMRHLSLTFSQFILLRLEGALGATSAPH